jgi:hypothetical protein
MFSLRRMLLPVLAVLLLVTSGCVAAALVGMAGAGAGLGYSQNQKSQTSPKAEAPPKTEATATPAATAPRSSSVRLAPAPAALIECKLQDGETFAMSAVDCKAKGGSVS